MNTLTQKPRTAEFLLSEGPGEISREKIIMAPTVTGYPSGQVLGVISANKQYSAYDPAASDGTETAIGFLYGAVGPSEEPQPASAIMRLAEVSSWSVTGLDPDARGDLAAAFLLVRD